MTDLNVVLLRGRMANRDNRRASRDFVLSQAGHAGVGATAVAAGAAGLGGSAIGLVSTMGNGDELADHVTMDLDGKRITGWFWDFPFCNGDEIEVVAEEVDGKYFALSARRPSDELIATHPHCTRGLNIYLRKSFKYWLYSSTFTMLIMLLMYYFAAKNYGGMSFGDLLFQCTIGYGLYFILAIPIVFKHIKFVRIAEACFKAYGWPNVKNIDLYASSKAKRRGGEPTGYGQTVYRY